MSQPDIHDVVNQLCAPHTHREAFTYEHTNADGKTSTHPAEHETEHPALIDQLSDNVEKSTAADNGGRMGFRSKPAAHLDAIDAYTRIDLQAAKWVRELGEDDPGNTIACIRKLAGLLPSAHNCGRGKAKRDEKGTVVCCASHAIHADIRRWWASARVLTGWDSPPWRPDNTCPLCNEKGTLRVRLFDQIAMCTECGEAWDSETIGLLADHIRAENSEDEAA